MTSPWDCSELQEAASLLQGLLASAGGLQDPPRSPSSEPRPWSSPKPTSGASARTASAAPSPGAFGAPGRGEAPSVEAPSVEALVARVPEPSADPAESVDLSDLRYRSDQLERLLAFLCTRAGFHGALVADQWGLPVAVHEVPMAAEQVAAFTSVLGEALQQADRLLGYAGANHISMDVDFADKIVLHHLQVGGTGYYLLVFCRQDMEDRAEIELSLAQLAEVLDA